MGDVVKISDPEAIAFIASLTNRHVLTRAGCSRCGGLVARLLSVEGHRVLHVLGGRYLTAKQAERELWEWTGAGYGADMPKRLSSPSRVYDMGVDAALPEGWMVRGGCRGCRRPGWVVVNADWSLTFDPRWKTRARGSHS